MKLLALAKPLRLTTFEASAGESKSVLFSTNTHGNLFPSKNTSVSSTDCFHLIVL